MQEYRQKIREKERLISSFKRELSLLVELTAPDDIKKGVRSVHTYMHASMLLHLT